MMHSMYMTRAQSELVAVLIGLACAAAFVFPVFAHAQSTSENQLRATIYSQIMADPRAQTMSQAQIYSMVNALTLQAQAQGLTASAITYRPEVPGSEGPTSGTTFGTCSDISCSLSSAFGLDGSIPVIPIALFVLAGLFILIFGIMREMGHPHAQLPTRNP
jgi:hypothetical protein